MKKKIDAALIRVKCRAHKFIDSLGSIEVKILIKLLISIVVGALLIGLIVGFLNTHWTEIAQQIGDEDCIFRSSSAALF